MDSAALIIFALVISAALAFNFTNGFQDAANALSTPVSTKALTPRLAVLIATVFTFLGALISTQVAITIATGIVDPALITPPVVLAAASGAILWSSLTRYFHLPSSASHALLGGALAAVIAATGIAGVKWTTVSQKMIAPALVAPVLAFFLGAAVVIVLYWVLRRQAPGPVAKRFRLLQTLSSALMAASHGANDAQKTMGIIVLALAAGGLATTDAVPIWVVLSAALAMATGTYLGGWRIIKNRGLRIVRMESVNGFAAETTAASVNLASTAMGFPISTTHVINSSIVGVGVTKRISPVRWGIGRSIVTAWIITIPVAGLFAGLIYLILAALGLPEASQKVS